MPQNDDRFQELLEVLETWQSELKQIYRIDEEQRQCPSIYDVLNSPKVTQYLKQSRLDCTLLEVGSVNLDVLEQRHAAAFRVVRTPRWQNELPEFCAAMQAILNKAKQILADADQEAAYRQWLGVKGKTEIWDLMELARFCGRRQDTFKQIYGISKEIKQCHIYNILNSPKVNDLLHREQQPCPELKKGHINSDVLDKRCKAALQVVQSQGWQNQDPDFYVDMQVALNTAKQIFSDAKQETEYWKWFKLQEEPPKPKPKQERPKPQQEPPKQESKQPDPSNRQPEKKHPELEEQDPRPEWHPEKEFQERLKQKPTGRPLPDLKKLKRNNPTSSQASSRAVWTILMSGALLVGALPLYQAYLFPLWQSVQSSSTASPNSPDTSQEVTPSPKTSSLDCAQQADQWFFQTHPDRKGKPIDPKTEPQFVQEWKELKASCERAN